VFWRKAAFDSLLSKLDALTEALEVLSIRLTGHR